MATHKNQTKTTLLRLAVSAMLLIAGAYVLMTHWQIVLHGLRLARHAQASWLLVALLCTVATFCIAAAIYGVLALHRLRYRQTLLVEVSTGFVNRLLPSGIGGLGLHGLYLYKRKHTASEATVLVSVNNLLGMVAHLSLLAVVLVVRPQVFSQLHVGDDRPNTGLVLAIGVVALIILAIPRVRNKLLAFSANLYTSVRRFQPRQLAAAYILALALTITYTGILLACAHAVGIRLSILQVFIAFSIGMLTSTATPTPGGLVGAEAGLFAGFAIYGVSAPAASAAVVLYRLATYWLPLLPGVLALALARSRKLV